MYQDIANTNPEDEIGFVAITSPTLSQEDKLEATTPEELKGWYSFQVNIPFVNKVAFEGLVVLGSIYYPIILESLASSQAFQTHNMTVPCSIL
jgi:hypothetical protein